MQRTTPSRMSTTTTPTMTTSASTPVAAASRRVDDGDVHNHNDNGALYTSPMWTPTANTATTAAAAAATTTAASSTTAASASSASLASLLDDVTDLHERVSALQHAYKANTQHTDAQQQQQQQSAAQHTHCNHLASVYTDLAALLDADALTTTTMTTTAAAAADDHGGSATRPPMALPSSQQLLLQMVQWQRDAYATLCGALQAHQTQVYHVLADFRRALEQHTRRTEERVDAAVASLRRDTHTTLRAHADEAHAPCAAAMREMQTQVQQLHERVREHDEQLQQQQQQQQQRATAAAADDGNARNEAVASLLSDYVTHTALDAQLTTLQTTQRVWCEREVQSALQHAHDTWRREQQLQAQQHKRNAEELHEVAQASAVCEGARVLHACEALLDNKARTLREELDAVRSTAADAHAEAAAVHQSHVTTCHAHATRVDELARVVDALRATCTRLDEQAQRANGGSGSSSYYDDESKAKSNGSDAASHARAVQQQQQQKCDALDAAFHELRDWLSDLEQRVATRGEVRERMSQLQEHVTTLDRQLNALQASIDMTAATAAATPLTSVHSTPPTPPPPRSSSH